MDRYGSDVLRNPRRRSVREPQKLSADPGIVVEDAASEFCGLIVGTEKTIEGWAVRLEDRHGVTRVFPLRPGGFLVDGQPVTLTLPPPVQPPQATRSASGSVLVRGADARVARASRIWVEGVHDAELIERVWGHDLRIEGVVVEPLHGADHLAAALSAFGPGPGRRVGVMLDHLVAGSKETQVAEAAMKKHAPQILVVGHPYVDVWQAVTPRALGIAAWPTVPKGRPWKSGVIEALGWRLDEAEAWRRIMSRVRAYTDLEPAFLGRVEELIDFVTDPA